MANLKFKVGDILTNGKRTVILIKVEPMWSYSKQMDLTIYTVFNIEYRSTSKSFALSVEEDYKKIGETKIETLDILYG